MEETPTRTAERADPVGEPAHVLIASPAPPAADSDEGHPVAAEPVSTPPEDDAVRPVDAGVTHPLEGEGAPTATAVVVQSDETEAAVPGDGGSAEPTGATRAGLPPVVLWALAGLALLGLLAAAAYFVIPYPVSVDGKTAWVRLGASVADLRSRGVIAGHAGDLVSVRAKLIKRGGGDPPSVYVDGKTVGDSYRVWPGSTVRTVDGADRTEKIVTKRIALPIESETVGHGPVVMMSQPGSVGLREVTKGEVSGDVLKSATLVPAVPAVFVRTKYSAGARVIALTFDDGPQPSSTPPILAILRKFKVKATFFMIGKEAAGHPALARSVATDGNLIGNHSLGHKILGHAPYKTVVDQISGGAAAIQRATGVKPTWFRPPEGSLGKSVFQVAQANGERVMMWSIDPYDWKQPPPAVIAKWVVSRAKPGAVVIMHDGGGKRANTVAALPVIIAQLRAQGYQFVTLDEMFGARPGAGPSGAAVKTVSKAPAKAAPTAPTTAP
jgi:peptidoglycan-N-acetylglucosamine deacetylase